MLHGRTVLHRVAAMARLLVVEDDARIGNLLESALRANGHDVSWQHTGRSALAQVHAAQSSPYDLVLLDLGLPDVDGVDLCRELRAASPDSVIVMLTARRDEMDVVVGLEAGADDYLTKPFGLTELLARIRAHLRRRAVQVQPDSQPFVSGDLLVDPGARRATVRGAELGLRTKEFDLLARLVSSPGVAVSRETLMADVWDENWFGSTKTLDVHIAALRRRLADAGRGVDPPAELPEITTLRGYGYRIEPDPTPPPTT
jgi:DNA-binding response OmpR family regulator